jgi:hypothetical protein
MFILAQQRPQMEKLLREVSATVRALGKGCRKLFSPSQYFLIYTTYKGK